MVEIKIAKEPKISKMQAASDTSYLTNLNGLGVKLRHKED